MTNSEIKLETKLVGDISGHFFIPSFQRGYRWGKDEVVRLLDDIYTNGEKNYSLQPIVVKRNENSFEVIDGQQRLTTIFLIYKYMNISSSGFLNEPGFSLSYETREKSGEFLASLDHSKKDDNIDYWFIRDAYETIENWFSSKGKQSTLTNINKYFDENVRIIWYEVDSSEDSIALFTRLNIGKIPLTSAELVKAMFLSRDHNHAMNRTKQEEISLQWDRIERELRNESLWYFLTNQSNVKYQTRVDLILDLISDKPINSKEQYFTYFHFDELHKTKALSEIWNGIQHTFLILQDWYEDHELYHKIGYLIASNTQTLRDIYALSKKVVDGKRLTKSEFKIELDKWMKNSIRINVNHSELSYDKNSDYEKISKLLLLFNVESVRQNGEQTMWFPFEKFKMHHQKKASWSLEHIHAQRSEGMKKQEDWKTWLRLHLPSVSSLEGTDAELIENMKSAIKKEPLYRGEFETIQGQVFELLSSQGNIEYLHSISNLALLNMSDNAALSNSTFDVKRNAIIEMDRKGQYIPFCTKMVFLKYYSTSEDNQLHFWGQTDRIAYLEAINGVLQDYLDEAILIEGEHE